MLTRFAILFFIFICGVSEDGQSQEEQELSSTLDSLVHLGIKEKAFPGAQILIRYKDSILYHKAWGYHRYDSVRNVQLTDIYDLASVTKVTTGLPILMQLYGQDKFNLDRKAGDYIKEYKRKGKGEVTFREILAHQAGLKPYVVFLKEAQKDDGKYRCGTFKNQISKKYAIRITDSLFLNRNYFKKMKRRIKKTQLGNRGEYVYSGLTFLMMPEMIEKIVDQNFEKYLYENIYEPIGIQNLKYKPLRFYNRNQIVPTEVDTIWRHQLVHGRVHDEAAAMMNGISCNAGLFGDAKDLSTLFQFYLNEGSWKGEQIIPKEAIREFTRYQYEDNRRGLGFDKPLREYNKDLAYVAKDASHASFGHSGFTGTMVWADPKHNLVFVFLSNRVYPDRSHRKLYELSLRPQLHQAVYDYIHQLEEKSTF